jgi:hypothetical protein
MKNRKIKLDGTKISLLINICSCKSKKKSIPLSFFLFWNLTEMFEHRLKVKLKKNLSKSKNIN